MRLRDMLQVLNEIVGDLQIDSQSAGTNTGKSTITNFNKLHNAISRIQSFDFIADDINILKEKFSSFFYDKSSKVFMLDAEITPLREVVTRIKMKVTAVITAINQAIPPQNPNTISIKLPDYTNLDKVQGFIRKIDTILNQTLTDKFQGQVQFQNFDTGSSWIEVMIHNKDAVIYFGAFVKYSWNFVRDGYMDYLNMKHRAQILNLDVETRKNFLESIENDMKAKAAFNAKTLMEDFEMSEEMKEYHSKLTHSMRELGGLLLEGTEVRTAIDAPKEAKEAFPDPQDMKALVEQAVKLLAEANSSDDDGTPN